MIDTVGRGGGAPDDALLDVRRLEARAVGLPVVLRVRLFGPHARRRALRLERAEVLRDERHHDLLIHVAGQHERRVVGPVVLFAVFNHLLLRDPADVRHPAHDRVRVRARRIERRVELLLEERPRAVLAHPALLGDDVALGVELAEHRVGHPVGFQGEVELDLVLRQRDVVLRHLLPGGRVQARAARFLVRAPDFLADDGLGLLPVQEVTRLLLPLDDLRVVAALDLRFLGRDLREERVDLAVELQVLLERPGLDAHGVGALEHHVLVESARRR